MAPQAENKAHAEELLRAGEALVAHLSDIKGTRALARKEADGLESKGWDVTGRRRDIQRLTEAMDEKGKKLMGIWAQAQVYATLATVPDNLPEAPTPVPSKAPERTARDAVSSVDWLHIQAQSNFPNDEVRVRKIHGQGSTEVYEIKVIHGDEIARYSFVPDFSAEDPYKMPPSEQWTGIVGPNAFSQPSYGYIDPTEGGTR